MPRYKKNKQAVGDAGIQTTKSKSTSTKHKQKVKYSKSNKKIKSVEKSDGSITEVKQLFLKLVLAEKKVLKLKEILLCK